MEHEHSPSLSRKNMCKHRFRVTSRTDSRPWLLLVAAIVLVGGCASLPADVDRPVSAAYQDTENTRLGRLATESISAHPGESAFVLLDSGLDAFVARAVLAEIAEVSIDAQYYLFHADTTGKLFLHQLVKAADRGVRVRLLLDDMDLAGRDLGGVLIDSHPNMEVRVFNPFIRNSHRTLQLLTRFGKVTRRMHNKSFTVDNQATVVGGRNIGNEYFEANPDLEFADLDVLAMGPIVREVSTSFDDYWNSELSYPLSALVDDDIDKVEAARLESNFEADISGQQSAEYRQAVRGSTLANSMRAGTVTLFWGNAELVHDSPEKISESRDRTDLHLATQLRPHFDKLDQELIIVSPYFVPGRQGMEWLASIAERGVRVRILTNSLASTDVSVVHAGYSKYRIPLLRAGVEIYEVNHKLTPAERRQKKGPSGSSKASLHAKSFVFDREEVFIGSLNLDPRSVVENTELGIVITSPEMATLMAEELDANFARVAFRLELAKDDRGVDQIVWHGKVGNDDKTYLVDPYTSFWRRAGVAFLGLFPIESQL